jgi:signal transduction histidine kinase/CheY-like chemotaxis protein
MAIDTFEKKENDGAGDDSKLDSNTLAYSDLLLLQKIGDVSKDCYLIIDLYELKIVYANELFKNLWGDKFEELEPKDMLLVTPNAQYELERAPRKDAFLDSKLKIADSMLPIELFQTVNLGGKDKHAIIVCKNPANLYSLRQTELFRKIMEDFDSPLYIRDQDGKYIFCNRAFSINFLDSEPENVVGKTIFDLHKPLPKSLLDLYYTKELDIIKNSNSSIFDAEITLKDNNKKKYKFVCSSYGFKQIKLSGIICIMIEKDEIDAEEFKEQAAEIAGNAKLQLLSGVSHELRTPLNAILGFSEILLDKEENEISQNYLSIINSSSKALIRLIDNMVDYSRLEADKISINNQPFNIIDALYEIKDIYSQKLEESNINLIIDIDDGFPKQISGDEYRIKQIFYNIISNSVKFTKVGFIKIDLHFDYHDKLDEFITVTFAVEDSGIGIAEDRLPEVFSAFSNGASQDIKRFEGSGLGLSITHQLVNKLNGSININSKINQGTKVEISFPYMSYLQDKSNVIEPVIEEISSIKIKNSTILVADDVEFNRDLIREFISPFNINVLEAESGLETIEIINSIKPQLILLDLKMPDMNGIETAQRIKSDPNLSDIPIVAFTAITSPEADSLDPALFASSLLKPVTKNSLINELKKHLPVTSFLKELSIVAQRPEINFYVPIDEELKDHIPTLISILENEMEQKWKRTFGEYSEQKIRRFSDDLELVSKKFQIPFIEKYARALAYNIDQNNKSQAKKTLNEYPDIIERVKAMRSR